MNIKILVAALGCGLSFSSFAASQKASLSYKNITGLWSNPAIWDKTRVPEDGDWVYLNSGDNQDVTLTLDGDVTNSLFRLQFVPKVGSKTTLDGNGHTIRASERDEDFLGTEVFHVMGVNNSSHALSLEQTGKGLPTDDHFSRPAYKFVDPLIEVYVDEAGMGTVKFSRGTYNMAGAESFDSFRKLVIGNQNKAPAHVWFAGGTFDLPSINYKANAPENLITVSGADTVVRMHGIFSNYLGGWSPTKDCGVKHTDFVVSDGATFELGGLLDWRFNSDADTQYVSYRKYCPERLFAVRNGATVKVPSTANFYMNAARSRFEISNGGTFEQGRDFQLACHEVSTNCSLVLDGGVWKGSSGSIMFGTAAAATPLAVAVTNSTLTGVGASVIFNHSSGTIADSTIALSDAAYKAMVSSQKVLRLSQGSDLTVAGGAIRGFALTVGLGDGTTPESNTTLTIADGEHEFFDVYVGRGNGTATSTGTLRQTGGRILVSGCGSASWGSCDVSAMVGESAVADGYKGVLQLDGGTFVCNQLKGGTSSRNQGGGGWSVLSADGGRLVPLTTGGDLFVGRFDEAVVGPKGLTVDTAGCDAKVVQDFTDKPDEKGLFVKDGKGTLTLEVANYSVATTRVERGTLAVVSADANAFRTFLDVRPDATLSLAGADITALAVDDLVVDGGVIELDAGDVITVRNEVSLKDVDVRFTSDLTLGDSYAWLQAEGELSEETQAEIRRTVLANAVADGTHAKVSCDFAGGVTTVTLTIAEDVEPLDEAATTGWRGATSDWAADGNWTEGVPTAAKRAAFDSPTAEKNVSVAKDASVGAVRFGADGYVLSGGPLRVDAEQGASEISATAGANEIAAPVSLINIVKAPVAADATLTLSGPVTGGGLRKTGSGELTLGAANAFHEMLTAAGGRLVGTAADALNAPRAELVRDTLAVDGDCAAIPDLAIRAPAQAASVILDIRTNATVGGIANDAGAIVKRGAGSLVLDVKAGNANVLGSWKTGTIWGAGAATNEQGKIVKNGVCPYTTNFEFPADGSSITAGYSGFTIAEGNVTVRKPADVTASHVYASSAVLIGMPLAVCACEPSLTIDGAYFNARDNMPDATHFFNGAYLGWKKNAVTRSTVTILNDGTLYADTYRSGYGSLDAGAVAVTAITNGMLKSGYATYFSDATGSAVSRYRLKDAKLRTGAGTVSSAQFCGALDMDAENTILADANGNVARASVNNVSAGRAYFHDGGLFYVSVISAASKVANDFTFAFNDTEWRGAASGSYTLARQENYNGHVFFEMVGKGVIFDPKAGNTVTLDLPFSGAGGLQVKSGTVAFAADSYGFTGPCAVSEGAVADLTNAGAIDTAAFAGPGTVRSATVRRARIVQDVADDWTGGIAPTFDGSAVTGRLTVDFGRTEANPLSETLPQGLVVAKLVNGSTLASKSVKLLNTGREHVVGIARVTEDGDVVMDVIESGLMMIVR